MQRPDRVRNSLLALLVLALFLNAFRPAGAQTFTEVTVLMSIEHRLGQLVQLAASRCLEGK